jgi:hypothetical protein
MQQHLKYLKQIWMEQETSLSYCDFICLELAIDEKNEKIFWSNRNIGKGEIMSANFDGSNVKTITKGFSQYLSWIKIDNSKEYIYWTESEWNSSFHKAKLDGTGHELIFGMKNH